jgi:hypothetical protein
MEPWVEMEDNFSDTEHDYIRASNMTGHHKNSQHVTVPE